MDQRAAGAARRDVFEAAVKPHWPAMARASRRFSGVEWEDVLQDALLTAWRRWDSFDATRGSLRGWLIGVTLDQASKRARRRRPQPVAASAAVTVELSTRDVDVERAIARLSDRQRVAIELFYFLDLPIGEIATVMGCSTGTVKSTLSDARARLRDRLDGDHD